MLLFLSLVMKPNKNLIGNCNTTSQLFLYSFLQPNHEARIKKIDTKYRNCP